MGVKLAPFYIFRNIDIAPVESFIQKAAVRYHISSKDHASFFRHTDGFAQCLQFILPAVQVVQRAEKQRNVIGIVGEGG